MFVAVESFASVNANTLIIILAVIGYVIKTVGEGKGWFRTSATLRTENTDLLRRNSELEATTSRHEDTIRKQGEQIIRLEEQVRALEKLDQSAVLEALRTHEKGAKARHDVTTGLLARAVDALEAVGSKTSN